MCISALVSISINGQRACISTHTLVRPTPWSVSALGWGQLSFAHSFQWKWNGAYWKLFHASCSAGKDSFFLKTQQVKSLTKNGHILLLLSVIHYLGFIIYFSAVFREFPCSGKKASDSPFKINVFVTVGIEPWCSCVPACRWSVLPVSYTPGCKKYTVNTVLLLLSWDRTSCSLGWPCTLYVPQR